MSYSGVYADSLKVYQNGGQISNNIQKKVDGGDENTTLFGNVDYSASYDKVLDDFNVSGSDASLGSSADNGDDNTTDPADSGSNSALAQDGGTRASDEQIAQLRAAFDQVQDEQGWVGKAWNGIKNFFGHSNGSNAVEETINKAASGEISYEAAVEKLNTYASKQDSVVDTFANIASGLSVAIGVIGAPFTFGASLALGAGVGAAVKVGIKASDAATNDVAGDYTLKDGLKDAVTGGVGGVVTVATAGIGTAGTVVKEGGKVLIKETIKQGAIAGAKAGAIDGAVMAATDYTADAVFDGSEFTFGGLVSHTASGAAGGAVIGGTIGGLTSGVRARGANKAAAEVADSSTANVKAGTATTQDTVNAAAKEVPGETAEETAKKSIMHEEQPTGAKMDIPEGEKLLSGTQQGKVYSKNGKLIKNPTQRISRLKEMIKDGDIKTTQDAYKAGFSKTELSKSGKFNQLNAAQNEVMQKTSQDTAEASLKASQKSQAQIPDDLPEVPDTRLNALEEKIADGQIASVDDALKEGFSVDELKRYGHYDELVTPLNAAEQGVSGAVDETAEEGAKKLTFGQMTHNARENVVNLFKKGAKLRNMKPQDIRKAFTGKAKASANEFKAAYEAMKQTNEYKTNLVFRTFVEDAFNLGNSQQI
ncbi:TPA: hypothetical protein IAA68_07660 [Candidatus Galligastranaerophilus faecipullorum]|nr:hypothetical protein [Candidatus Galligastranaerophilus faecipullorum]